MEILEIFKKFTDQINHKGYSEKTLENYLHHLEKFFDHQKPKHPSILSSQDVNNYLTYLVESDKGESYKNQSINAIRFCFTYVFNRKLKAYLVVRPKKAKTQPILLSDEEMQLLFDVCTNVKHRAILSLLYSGGLRVSEIINLKIEDIDSKCMVIRIHDGKGKKDRMVQLDTEVLILLRKYFREYKPKEYLFNGWKEEPQYTVRSIEQFVSDLGKKANISKRVHPHLLRHQYITGMLENGEDIYTAQLLAGHSKTSTTIGYSHLRDKFISKVPSPINNIRL